MTDRFAAARRALELQYREARPCGTEAAYRRHLRNGEQACPDCRAAHATYNDERAAARAATRHADTTTPTST